MLNWTCICMALSLAMLILLVILCWDARQLRRRWADRQDKWIVEHRREHERGNEENAVRDKKNVAWCDKHNTWIEEWRRWTVEHRGYHREEEREKQDGGEDITH